MFMLRQTSDKMAVLLHKQASVRFHSLLTVLHTFLDELVPDFEAMKIPYLEQYQATLFG